jgi:hypothetical protein
MKRPVTWNTFFKLLFYMMVAIVIILLPFLSRQRELAKE